MSTFKDKNNVIQRDLGEQLESLRLKLSRKESEDRQIFEESSTIVNGYLTCKFRNLGCDFSVPSMRNHEWQYCR